MSVSDPDQQLLEQYLDREVEPSAVEPRLAREPALAAELARLRGQRQVRRAAMNVAFAGDADRAAIERLVASVRAARVGEDGRRRAWWAGGYARSAFAAAACMAVGLSVGLSVGGQRAGVAGDVPIVGGPADVGTPVGFDPQALRQRQEPGVVVLRDARTGEVKGKIRFASPDDAKRWVDGYNRQRQGEAAIGEPLILSQPY